MPGSFPALQVFSATISYQTGMIECRCLTPATAYFGVHLVDNPIIVSEQVDLSDNPAWTNEDLRQALAIKTGIPAADIKFFYEFAVSAPPPVPQP